MFTLDESKAPGGGPGALAWGWDVGVTGGDTFTCGAAANAGVAGAPGWVRAGYTRALGRYTQADWTRLMLL